MATASVALDPVAASESPLLVQAILSLSALMFPVLGDNSIKGIVVILIDLDDSNLGMIVICVDFDSELGMVELLVDARFEVQNGRDFCRPRFGLRNGRVLFDDVDGSTSRNIPTGLELFLVLFQRLIKR